MSPDVIQITIISGGQTGADRAALDFALDFHFPCGGWCPAGRCAEDGHIPDRYPLQETSSRDYAVRTRKNITFSDGTLLFTFNGAEDKGTTLTRRETLRYGKPLLGINLPEPSKVSKALFTRWLNENNIRILNIAGPRESFGPGIYTAVYHWLKVCLL
ncbi:MAG: molybdenum cofactor carrier [Chlorobi bacterium]|nr:molybdenum cofactor carrier [Chlorobiota bacterium]